MDNNNKKQQLNIELGEDQAEGVYSNLAIITHSQSEFVLDFIRIMPGVPKAKVKSRVVLTPQHAKRLMRTLGDNINKVEQMNGPIKELTGPEHSLPMNFSGPKGEA